MRMNLAIAVLLVPVVNLSVTVMQRITPQLMAVCFYLEYA